MISRWVACKAKGMKELTWEGVESEEKSVQRQSPEEYLFVKRQPSVGEAAPWGRRIPGLVSMLLMGHNSSLNLYT